MNYFYKILHIRHSTGSENATGSNTLLHRCKVADATVLSFLLFSLL